MSLQILNNGLHGKLSERKVWDNGQRLSVELLFQRHWQGVDFGGEDEIVFGEAADRVRVEFDGHVAIPLDVDVGVMAVALGHAGDVIQEVHCGHVVLHDPRFADAFVIRGQFPAGQMLDLSLSLGGGQLRHAPFAGNTLFAAELITGLD